jgi:hypothetical protein
MGKRKTKAEKWAESDPEERARLYLSMRDHLIKVAEELGDRAEPGEAMALRLTGRQFAGTAAAIKHAAALRETCCGIALQFGSCGGHA